MGDRDLEEPRESEDVDAALDRAVELVGGFAAAISTRILTRKDGPQRDIDAEALREALEYRIRKLHELSDEELFTIDRRQQEAFLNNIYRLRRKSIGKKEGKHPPLVSLDEERDKDPSDEKGSIAPFTKFRPNDSVAVMAFCRLLELMIERTNRPRLDGDQATVARFYLDCELGLPVMTPEDADRMQSFPDGARYWKQNLAKSLGKKQASFVSETIEKILLAARTAIYLFILLAPIGRAVLVRSRMAPLLDLVHRTNHHLETYQRKLLERAAPCLLLDDDDFLIDVVELAKAPGPGGPMPVEVTLRDLHRAEATYAARVPSQEHHPPRFRCIVRCDLHRPIEEN